MPPNSLLLFCNITYVSALHPLFAIVALVTIRNHILPLVRYNAFGHILKKVLTKFELSLAMSLICSTFARNFGDEPPYNEL